MPVLQRARACGALCWRLFVGGNLRRVAASAFCACAVDPSTPILFHPTDKLLPLHMQVSSLKRTSLPRSSAWRRWVCSSLILFSLSLLFYIILRRRPIYLPAVRSFPFRSIPQRPWLALLFLQSQISYSFLPRHVGLAESHHFFFAACSLPPSLPRVLPNPNPNPNPMLTFIMYTNKYSVGTGRRTVVRYFAE
jgi:hypothetical protein